MSCKSTAFIIQKSCKLYFFLSFSYAPNIVYLLYSGTQGTRKLKEPHCYSPLLPLALLPTIHTSRKKSYPDIAPPPVRIGPSYVQHLAK